MLAAVRPVSATATNFACTERRELLLLLLLLLSQALIYLTSRLCQWIWTMTTCWRHCDVMSLSCHSVDAGDDSGNSSSSSSSVILSLEQISACEPTQLSSSSSLLDDSDLWQPDYSLYYCGYELADFADTSSQVLLPLHKTVCCALCRSETWVILADRHQLTSNDDYVV